MGAVVPADPGHEGWFRGTLCRMSTRVFGLGFFLAFILVRAGAGCGGKVSAPQGGDTGAGLLGTDAGAVGVDGGVAVDASFTDAVPLPPACPAADLLFKLGGTCTFSGPCTLDLDACDTGQGTSTTCACVSGHVQLPAGEGIACVGHTGGGPDASSPPSGKCALAAPCTAPGTICTNPGAGPCGSDQRLACKSDVWVADGFPCTSPSNEGCGFGMAGPNGCSEMCGCDNGLEVCTGDCPDGGPANP